MSSKILFDESDYSESDCDYIESETNENVVEKPIIRYEDKYLEDVRKMVDTDTDNELDEIKHIRLKSLKNSSKTK